MVTLIDTAAAAPRRRVVQPPVRVNGVTIDREAIMAEMQHHPADTAGGAREAAVRALVVRELLLREAARLGIAATPEALSAGKRESDEEATIRALVEDQVSTPTAGEEDCRRYFEMNRRRFRSPDAHEVRHILLAAAPSDEAGRTAAREQARALAASLVTAPADFARLALALSACPSKEAGGSLGLIGPGQTVPEFEKALAAITPGTVHPDPVETRYGLHVVALDRRFEGRDLPYEQVRHLIAAYLDETVRRRALSQYVTLLAGQASIEGADLASDNANVFQ